MNLRLRLFRLETGSNMNFGTAPTHWMIFMIGMRWLLSEKKTEKGPVITCLGVNPDE